MSGVQTEDIRSTIQSHLSKKDENRVIIYFGNIESEEELARLNIHLAKEVYILGDGNTVGRDSKSIESVHKISKLRGNLAGKDLLDVYVQFDRIPSYSNIQKMNLPKDYVCYGDIPNIYFLTGNNHRHKSASQRSFGESHSTTCPRRIICFTFPQIASGKHLSVTHRLPSPIRKIPFSVVR